jgi:hypothetical protein
MELVLGAGQLDRVISDADELLREYRGDTGYEYLKYRPVTPQDKLVPEDIEIFDSVWWMYFRAKEPVRKRPA